MSFKFGISDTIYYSTASQRDHILARYKVAKTEEKSQFSFITYSDVEGLDDVNGVFELESATYFLVPCDSSLADCHLWVKSGDRGPAVRENEGDRKQLYELQKREGVSSPRS